MRRGPHALPLASSAAYFLLLWLPSLSSHYGFYSDELYYLACADRQAWGYVDHPPFFVLLLRVQRELFGDSLLALRALPAAAGAVTVFLTCLLTRQLGGGVYAQLLAMLAWMVGQSLANFSFFSVNCIAILLWTLATVVFVQLCVSRDPRWWLATGVVLGLGFLTKHTILLLGAGLAFGTLATPLRRDLATRWPWLGLLLVALLAAPNLGWQLVNDWPSLEFYRSRQTDALLLSPLQAIELQIFAQNPATLPVWLSGVWFLLRSPQGRPFRALGLAFGLLLALVLVSGQSIPYRIVGIYPVVFAAGAVWLEARRAPGAGALRRVWDTWALPGVMLLFGAAAASLVLPIVPPEQMLRHPLHGGDDVWRERVDTSRRPPYHLANRTHWPDLVAAVAAVVATLEPAQRERAILLLDYFGHAGALEYYGGAYDLPAVYSNHTGYYLWGPPEATPAAIVSIGIDEALLRRHYERVEVAAVFRCRLCPAWQDELPIHVASFPTTDVSALWQELGEVRGMDYYRRRLRESARE